MQGWRQRVLSNWHRLVHAACVRLFLSKVTILNRDNLPEDGPAIYLALHRNGAVDEFIYHRALPRMTAMISSALNRNFFLRLFIGGIEVVRRKDARSGENYRQYNSRALHQCVDLLHSGGELLIFPEGTSSIGPSHLPFKGSASYIAAEFLKDRKALPVIPIGIRYERAWAFRSRVEVCIGHPVSTSLDPMLTESERVKVLRRRFDHALENIGINVESEAYQERIQKLAYISTLGTDQSYYEALKRFERSISAPMSAGLDQLAMAIAGKKLLYHQGVPLFPIGAVVPYVLGLLMLEPLVLAALLLNGVPLVGAYTVARKFADDRNMIALWKILAGVPLFVLWSLAITAGCLTWGRPGVFAIYALLSVLGGLLFKGALKR